MGVDGWAGWKTEATAYLEFTKMGHTKIKSEGTKLGNGVWVGFGTRRLLSPHIGLPAEHKLGLPDAHNWLVDLELRKNLSERYQWVMGECSLNLFQFIIS